MVTLAHKAIQAMSLMNFPNSLSSLPQLLVISAMWIVPNIVLLLRDHPTSAL